MYINVWTHVRVQAHTHTHTHARTHARTHVRTHAHAELRSCKLNLALHIFVTCIVFMIWKIQWHFSSNKHPWNSFIIKFRLHVDHANCIDQGDVSISMKKSCLSREEALCSLAPKSSHGNNAIDLHMMIYISIKNINDFFFLSFKAVFTHVILEWT